MKKLLIFACATAFALMMMDFRQIVTTPSGLGVVTGGSAYAADMPPPHMPPPPPPMGKGKAPVVGKGPVGKGKAPIVARG
jgi:hypothetical protein